MSDDTELTSVPTSDLAPDFESFEPGAIPEHVEIQNLRAAVLARVVSHFASTEVPHNFIEPYAEEVVRDIEDELAKFARGQKEHGGDVRDRDLHKDMSDEVRDLAIYTRCIRLQRPYVRLMA